jgi:hypothetical protein
VITERRRALGDWGLNLHDVPASLMDRLTFDFNRTDHLAAATLVITPARVDADALGNTDTGTAYHPLFDLAIYTGVLAGISGMRDQLTGYGIAWHLGNHEEGGMVFAGTTLGLPDTDQTTRVVELDTDDWFAWLVNGGARLAQDGITNIDLDGTRLYGVDTGYSSAPAADPVPYFPDFLTRRELLTRICNYVGWTWYVSPQMVVHAGEVGDIWPSPRAVVAADLDSDPDWWTITSQRIEWDESIDGYTNKAAAFIGSTTPGQTFAYPNDTVGTISEDMFGPDGDPIINIVRDDATNEESAADWRIRQQQSLPAREVIRRQVTIQGSVHDHGNHLIPGEPLWVYEPRVGLVDTDNEIHVGGEVIHPVAVALHTVTWPVVDGMGVYLVYHDQTAGELAHIDLSDVVVYEDQSTTLEVGAPSVAL